MHAATLFVLHGCDLCCNAGLQVASNDDCDAYQHISCVDLVLTAGVTYMIQVDGFEGDFGNVVLGVYYG